MKKTFEEWKKEVDEKIAKMTGLGSDDIPDWDYKGAYERGVSSTVAAKKAVAAARNF